MASVDIKRKSEELCNVYLPQLTVTILGVAINLFRLIQCTMMLVLVPSLNLTLFFSEEQNFISTHAVYSNSEIYSRLSGKKET